MSGTTGTWGAWYEEQRAAQARASGQASGEQLYADALHDADRYALVPAPVPPSADDLRRAQARMEQRSGVAAQPNERGAGLKFDSGKVRLALLPWDALVAVGEILTFGARKYKAHSWRSVENARERYTDALLRHLAAFEQGEWLDADSGLPHVGHLACNALFICALALSERRAVAKRSVPEENARNPLDGDQ